MVKKLCIVCNKSIRAFKTSKDWESRTMHKTCWVKNEKTEKKVDCIACNDSGIGYIGDGIGGACLVCNAGAIGDIKMFEW